MLAIVTILPSQRSRAQSNSAIQAGSTLPIRKAFSPWLLAASHASDSRRKLGISAWTLAAAPISNTAPWPSGLFAGLHSVKLCHPSPPVLRYRSWQTLVSGWLERRIHDRRWAAQSARPEGGRRQSEGAAVDATSSFRPCNTSQGAAGNGLCAFCQQACSGWPTPKAQWRQSGPAGGQIAAACCHHLHSRMSPAWAGRWPSL